MTATINSTLPASLAGDLPRKTFAPLKVVKIQLVAASVLALLWWFFKSGDAGVSAAVSAFAGGAICFVPAGLFAWRLRTAAIKQQHEGYIVAFLLGEALKVFLSIALFALVALKWSTANWLALISSYIVVLQVYVFGLLLVRE